MQTAVQEAGGGGEGDKEEVGKEGNDERFKEIRTRRVRKCQGARIAEEGKR